MVSLARVKDCAGLFQMTGPGISIGDAACPAASSAEEAVIWMAVLRDFRFATTSFELTRAGVLADARTAEQLGYDTFGMSDHL
jgi:hypothetical protein